MLFEKNFNMNQRNYLRINSLLFTLALTVLFSHCTSKEALPPPNILWIVSEDNGPYLGCYGDNVATTPHLDAFASEGVLFTRAYSSAPVCAPSRATLITGMYPPALGVENMRSTYPVPSFIRFYPHYLKEAGYYTSNNHKKDYNTTDQPSAWHESSKEATYEKRAPGQPFFHVSNLYTTHESRLHLDSIARQHTPGTVKLPAYHPDTKEVRNDWGVYYDRIQDMDQQVGEILQKLEREGLAENTIIFYFSDHGGAVAGSKRFLFESGLRVPLIVRIPEKYKHLSPHEMGTRTDQVVSFIDFKPTLLNLAGLEIPGYTQGQAFLGENIPSAQPYAYAFRGRMDERIDLSRSVSDGRFRYTRNFMPHRPYSQYVGTLWKAPGMRAWEASYQAGELNPAQERFFLPKPFEELYDLTDDPDNIKNLAGQPAYQKELERLRSALDQWQLENKDAGFIPESFLDSLSSGGTVYEYIHSTAYPVDHILDVAKMGASGKADHVDTLTQLLQHENAIIRYWAATGLIHTGREAGAASELLLERLKDPSPAVSIAAAEALFHLGQKKIAIEHLTGVLSHENMHTRLLALNTLEYTGNDAKAALPVIQELIRPKEDREYDNRAMWRLVEKLSPPGTNDAM